jgi:single-stranded-DNA-specific exonuclease
VNLCQGEKYLWRLPEDNTELVFNLSAAFNLSYAVTQTLVNRGMQTSGAIEAFLFSSFEKDVAHPSRLKGAQEAVERIERAVHNKEKILIFGDYDVDGITSTSLMLACLLPLGAQVNFFLPNRVRDGYGLSTKVVERAAKNGYSLIITVDNGITALEPARCARELGIDIIVTDHHRPQDELPHACAIVDPNQDGCDYPYKHFAGVGVSFKLMSLLYERRKLNMPTKAYELLLLGTVADVVPLDGENRFWVRYCLHHVHQVESYSLEVLKKNGKITKSTLTSTDIGFSIAPQINALGRLEDPRQGVKFLLGTNKNEVDEVGRILFELNQARRVVERNILDEIEKEIEAKRIDPAQENIVMAGGTAWPSGVIGLVASRLVSAYGKPALLFHLSKNGIAKGSCRSIPEFNMFDALRSCSDLLESFGGHSFAAGLSLKTENLPRLKQRLETLIAEQLTEFDLKQKLALDATVQLGDLTTKFMDDLNNLEPFGNANIRPTFFVKNVVQVQKPVLLKEQHVKCMVFADGVMKPLVFFNRPELFELLVEQADKPFHVAAQISENHWNGRVSIELLGLDIARS